MLGDSWFGLIDTGILRSTLLPNVAFSSSLVLPTYLLQQKLNLPISTRSFWTATTLGNVFWLAFGPSLALNLNLGPARGPTSRPLSSAEITLLAGITLSSLGVIYSDLRDRTSSPRGLYRDDRLYTGHKGKEEGWTGYLRDWGGKILLHSLITLPVLVPFRSSFPVLSCPEEWRGTVRGLAVGAWAIGQAFGLTRPQGIVRHPDSLSIFLQSLAYPLYLFTESMFNPVFLVSPIATYFTLASHDLASDQAEEDDLARKDPGLCIKNKEDREGINSFWPGWGSLREKTLWIILAVGGGAAATATNYLG